MLSSESGPLVSIGAQNNLGSIQRDPSISKTSISKNGLDPTVPYSVILDRGDHEACTTSFTEFIRSPSSIEPRKARSTILSTYALPAHQQSNQSPVELLEYPPESVAASTAYKRTYTCFYLLAAVMLLLFASLAVSLWWSVDHYDVSGGFGMGSYMVGISGTIVAVASYIHRSSCRCWKHEQCLPRWEVTIK